MCPVVVESAPLWTRTDGPGPPATVRRDIDPGNRDQRPYAYDRSCGTIPPKNKQQHTHHANGTVDPHSAKRLGRASKHHPVVARRVFQGGLHGRRTENHEGHAARRLFRPVCDADRRGRGLRPARLSQSDQPMKPPGPRGLHRVGGFVVAFAAVDIPGLVG